MRKGELIFNLSVFFGPAVLGFGVVSGIVMAVAMPHLAFWVTMTLFICGFVAFAKAKLSVISKGYIFSFGSRYMSLRNKVAYFCGYGAMGVSLMMSMGILTVMSGHA